jgi:predicted transcriptional regulator
MITPVKKVMSKKLITVKMGTSLHDAYLMMKEKRIRHLPVVDIMDDIVGILSHRDLSAVHGSKNIPVEMFMTSPVEFVDKGLSLRSAILHMLEKKISCLLIADEHEDAVGIVTTDDLLWHLAHLLSAEEDEQPILSAMDRETIGTIANQLANMGI